MKIYGIEKNTKFKGIIEKIDHADEELKYSVSCIEIEQIFNRKIILSDVEIISRTGIEDFIAKAIKTCFTESGDDFSDMSYIHYSLMQLL